MVDNDGQYVADGTLVVIVSFDLRPEIFCVSDRIR